MPQVQKARTLPKSVIQAKNIKDERLRRRKLSELGRYGNRVRGYKRALELGGQEAAQRYFTELHRQLQFSEFAEMARQANEDICPVDD